MNNKRFVLVIQSEPHARTAPLLPDRPRALRRRARRRRCPPHPRRAPRRRRRRCRTARAAKTSRSCRATRRSARSAGTAPRFRRSPSPSRRCGGGRRGTTRPRKRRSRRRCRSRRMRCRRTSELAITILEPADIDTASSTSSSRFLRRALSRVGMSNACGRWRARRRELPV